MTAKQLYRFYNGALINDTGIYVSEEARQFFYEFKVALKRKFSCYDIKILRFNVGHYDCSFFCEKNGKFVYCSYSIERGLPLDLDAKNILYRTATNRHDYRGGKNNYSDWLSLAENISKMLSAESERRNAS